MSTIKLSAREIKFRAWNNVSKSMSKPFTFEEIRDEESEANYTVFDNIMQYTWLKDKNWVEVYEGDILNCTAPKPYHTDSKTSYVVFKQREARFELQKDACLPIGRYTEIEVIWNIFENQEILEA